MGPSNIVVDSGGALELKRFRATVWLGLGHQVQNRWTRHITSF